MQLGPGILIFRKHNLLLLSLKCGDMDSISSSQDLLRCLVKKKRCPHCSCQPCDKNICTICAGEHLLDDTKEHKIVTIKQKWNTTNPLCPKVKHTSKLCDLYCVRNATTLFVHCAFCQVNTISSTKLDIS